MSDESDGKAGGPKSAGAPIVDDVGICNVHYTADDWNVHSNNSVDLTARIAPTQEAYPEFQLAYEYLNSHLFDNKLPNCLITLQRHKGSYGYFIGDRFGRTDGERTDEIALNPQYFLELTTEEILSTQAHEMAHLWQHHLGERKPARANYHNKEWADKMEAIGLIASDTGKPGGKRTGDRMSHYIEPGGRFAQVVEQLLARRFEITWREISLSSIASVGGGGNGEGDGGGNEEGGNVSLSGKRTKYTCPHGDLNAWAKPGAELLCGKHLIKMMPASNGLRPLPQ